MPTIRYRSLLLAVRTHDHPPAHVHVLSQGGQVDIVILLGPPLSLREIDGPAKRPDINRAFAAVALRYDALVTLWEKFHGKR